MAKIISIIAVVTLVSLAFWITAEPWVGGDVKFALVQLWIWPAALLTVLAAVAGLAYMLLPDFRWRWSVSWIMAGGFLAVFGVSWYHVLATLFVLLITLYAIQTIQRELTDRAKVHIYVILRRGMNAIILPLLLALSFAYYQSPALQRRLEERTVPVTYHQVIDVTLETFLRSEKANLSEAEQEEVKNQVANQLFEQFYAFTDRYAVFLPPILAFGLFLILWGLSFVFVYVSVGLGMLLFWLLRTTKFLRIEEKQIMAQVIKL